MEDRARTLLVQRTGSGKSLVYFIATRILRDQGLGPALLISPLLSLMRNQVEASSAARSAAGGMAVMIAPFTASRRTGY